MQKAELTFEILNFKHGMQLSLSEVQNTQFTCLVFRIKLPHISTMLFSKGTDQWLNGTLSGNVSLL